jgi:hypothetical protein
MRPSHPLLLSLALGTLACSKPFPCNRYCWSHQQLVADINSEHLAGVPDGRFDDTCLTSSDSEEWYPPLPPFGWYAAEQCVKADVHEVIARTVTSIQDPSVDAGQACDVTELQIYADFVQALALQARNACVAHLTCNGMPAGCDIDPTDDGNQACTVATAEVLCDQEVLAPALAALTDLTNGPGAAQPQRDGVVIEYVDDPQQCSPILQADTEGTPGCEDGGGDGLDESGSSGSDGGADESGGGSSESGGSMVEPFGEIGALVRCATPRTCVVAPELFAAVESNFGLFVDEGLRLEVVAMPEIGAGVRISGLERAQTSGRLLRALGIEEGDVLMELDGRSIVEPETLEALMLELPTARSWRLTLRRRVGGVWGIVVVTISRE